MSEMTKAEAVDRETKPRGFANLEQAWRALKHAISLAPPAAKRAFYAEFREGISKLFLAVSTPKLKSPAVDMSVIKQAGAFHTMLVEFADDYCGLLEAWHAAHPDLDDESKFCVMQALDLTAQRFFQLSQALDGR